MGNPATDVTFNLNGMPYTIANAIADPATGQVDVWNWGAAVGMRLAEQAASQIQLMTNEIATNTNDLNVLNTMSTWQLSDWNDANTATKRTQALRNAGMLTAPDNQCTFSYTDDNGNTQTVPFSYPPIQTNSATIQTTAGYESVTETTSGLFELNDMSPPQVWYAVQYDQASNTFYDPPKLYRVSDLQSYFYPPSGSSGTGAEQFASWQTALPNGINKITEASTNNNIVLQAQTQLYLQSLSFTSNDQERKNKNNSDICRNFY